MLDLVRETLEPELNAAAARETLVAFELGLMACDAGRHWAFLRGGSWVFGRHGCQSLEKRVAKWQFYSVLTLS